MQKSPANEFPPPANALLQTFNTQDAHRQNPRLGRSPHVTIKHRLVVQVLRDIAARRDPYRNRSTRQRAEPARRNVPNDLSASREQVE
jgi:hypothetical protein